MNKSSKPAFRVTDEHRNEAKKAKKQTNPTVKLTFSVDQCEEESQECFLDPSKDVFCGFGLFFSTKFVSFLLDGRERSFEDMYSCLSKQWDQLCTSAKTVYEARSSRHANLPSDKSQCEKLVTDTNLKLAVLKNFDQIESGFDLYCNTLDNRDNGAEQMWNVLDTQTQTDYNNRVDKFKQQWYLEAEETLLSTFDSLQTCVCCQFNFTTMEEFHRHISEVDHSANELVCPACPVASFDTSTSLIAHVNKHRGLFACVDCPNSFDTKKQLEEHRHKSHLFPCNVCLDMFSNGQSQKSHRLKMHLGHTKTCCEYCSVSLEDPERLNSHVIRRHYLSVGLNAKDPLVLSKKYPTTGKAKKKHQSKVSMSMESTLACADCQVQFGTLAQLKYHRLKTHGKWQGQLKCDLCSNVYGTESNLRRHLRNAHQSGPLAQKVATKSCQQCPFQTRDAYHLKVHARKHTGERPFVCAKCTYGFYKKSDLSSHTKRCKGVRYQCEQCQQVFHFRKQLKDHSVWSETCGTVTDKAGSEQQSLVQQQEGEEVQQRYMKEKPSMVRLNISRDTSVVGVNCENLIDTNVFAKRKKRARCGICKGCEKTADCQVCKNCCTTKGQRKRTCEQRQCINLVYHYDVRRDKRQLWRTVEPEPAFPADLDCQSVYLDSSDNNVLVTSSSAGSQLTVLKEEVVIQ